MMNENNQWRSFEKDIKTHRQRVKMFLENEKKRADQKEQILKKQLHMKKMNTDNQLHW